MEGFFPQKGIHLFLPALVAMKKQTRRANVKGILRILERPALQRDRVTFLNEMFLLPLNCDHLLQCH